MSADDLLDSLRWRYATKRFDPARPIDPALWAKLEEAVTLAPSSYGLQPWKFFVVTDAALRATLRDAAWKQPQVTDASHLVVFAVRSPFGSADVDRLIARTAEVRGVPPESLDGYRQMMLGDVVGRAPADVDSWCSRQLYLALGVFLSACAVVGVDACPMEGFEGPKFDEILKLREQGYSARVLATAGYRSAGDRNANLPKVRYPVEEVVARIA